MKTGVVLLAMAFWSSVGFASCVVTADGPLACTNGPATWDRHNGSNIYNAACNGPNQCRCGAVGTEGFCGGCTWQSAWDGVSCFSENTCATACIPVPELGTSGEFFAQLRAAVRLFMGREG